MIETLALTPPFFLFDEEFDVPRRFRHDTREGVCFTRSKQDSFLNNQDAMAGFIRKLCTPWLHVADS